MKVGKTRTPPRTAAMPCAVYSFPYVENATIFPKVHKTHVTQLHLTAAKGLVGLPPQAGITAKTRPSVPSAASSLGKTRRTVGRDRLGTGTRVLVYGGVLFHDNRRTFVSPVSLLRRGPRRNLRPVVDVVGSSVRVDARLDVPRESPLVFQRGEQPAVRHTSSTTGSLVSSFKIAENASGVTNVAGIEGTSSQRGCRDLRLLLFGVWRRPLRDSGRFLVR